MRRQGVLQKIVLGILFGTVQLSCQSSEELKREQYYSEGYQLYTAHCANCHQANGKGMGNLYPPLDSRDYLPGKDAFACIVKNGLNEEISVGKRKFNRPMPANTKLTDIEIAEIATYVYNTWAADTTYMRIDSVSNALNRCQKLD